MTLQELIELAILDAMGLLDEDERITFENAFQSAAPAVQAQVRREQTRLSQIDMLLPDVAPPSSLRAIVLQAVREEIARTSAKENELVVPIMFKSRGVSPVWRAASLALAAAVLVLVVTMFMFQTQHQRTIQQFRNDAFIAALSEHFGAAFVRDVLFNGDTQRVLFVSEDPTFHGQASLFVNPDWQQSKFFCHLIQTPEGQKFRVAIVDDEDRVVQELASFTSNGELLSRDVALRFERGQTLAIVAGAESPGEQLRIIGRGLIEG